MDESGPTPETYKRTRRRRTPFGGTKKVTRWAANREKNKLVGYQGEMPQALYERLMSIATWEGVTRKTCFTLMFELGIEVYDVMLKRLDGSLPDESPTFAPAARQVLAPVRDVTVREAADSIISKLQALGDDDEP